MEGFTKYCPIDRSLPTENGAYNVIVLSRDGVPVIRVAYLNIKDGCNLKWTQQYISEYGYSQISKLPDEQIAYFKRIEGVTFEVIPESYKIDILGVKEDDDEE